MDFVDLLICLALAPGFAVCVTATQRFHRWFIEPAKHCTTPLAGPT